MTYTAIKCWEKKKSKTQNVAQYSVLLGFVMVVVF